MTKNTVAQVRRKAMNRLRECGRLAAHIRDWVNEGMNGEVKNKLLQDRRQWLPVCASMDVLEDSLEAMRHYIRFGLCRKSHSEYNSIDHNVGGKYLRLYGALQALSLNQDAITNLHNCLTGKQITHAKTSRWHRVRRLRVCIAGHPHNPTSEGPTFLSRVEIGSRGFRYNCYRKHEHFVSERIDLDAEVADYLTEAAEILKSMASGFPLERALTTSGLIREPAKTKK